MTKGLPGSGKSTWALEQVRQSKGTIKRVNKDSLRLMIDGGQWSRKNEKFVVLARNFIIEAALLKGYSVIVDDTNFAPEHEQNLRRCAETHKVEFLIEDFSHVPLEVCIERDLKRAESVGPDVIKRMWKQYLKPQLWPQDPSLPAVYICDLDGTLANIDWRNPYDASQCLDDPPNDHVLSVIRELKARGNIVLFFSGRSDQYAPQTVEWLYKWGLLRSREEGQPLLFMRKQGDSRKDSIVKREMFEQNVLGKYRVIGIFDDRPQVIRMWRYELGLPVFDVGDGVEF
jgi:predicted kinase